MTVVYPRGIYICEIFSCSKLQLTLSIKAVICKTDAQTSLYLLWRACDYYYLNQSVIKRIWVCMSQHWIMHILITLLRYDFILGDVDLKLFEILENLLFVCLWWQIAERKKERERKNCYYGINKEEEYFNLFQVHTCKCMYIVSWYRINYLVPRCCVTTVKNVGVLVWSGEQLEGLYIDLFWNYLER